MSDYGYPYLEQQLAAQPVQQQVYPQPQGSVPVDQAMPPPAVAPSAYLSKLAEMLHQSSQQQSPTAQTPGGSSNPYSLNNGNNPYAIEGNPLDGLQSKAKQPSTDTPAPKA